MEQILVVDDDSMICKMINRILTPEGYECVCAESGEKALEILGRREFGLMLSDIGMPGINGIELLGKALDKYPDMAVVMVTGLDDRDISIKALEEGAYAYIIKPFTKTELLINIMNALRRRKLEIAHRRRKEELEAVIEKRTRQLRRARDEIRSSREETILRLAKAAEFRDDETAQHTLRMSYYCRMLAQKAGLPQNQWELIKAASPLHDVGKIGTPDHILLKPGRLTDEEMDVIKQHPEIGYRILSGSDSDLLNMAATIALTHHEKFDGSGYPTGLFGDKIPLEGRIAAICDVFDALTSDRVYKKAMPVEKAVSIIEEGRGAHFDPDLAGKFLESLDEVLKIKREFSDDIQRMSYDRKAQTTSV